MKTARPTTLLDATRSKVLGVLRARPAVVAQPAPAPATPSQITDATLRMCAEVVPHLDAGPPRMLLEHLARELSWTRMLLRALRDDVEHARAHREHRGGQHAGTPPLAGLPPSLLQQLDRLTRSAFNGAPDHLTLATLVEEATRETP